VGAVRQLLVLVYGELGLSCAYQLAGQEKPDKVVWRVDGVTGPDATPAASEKPDLLDPVALRTMPPRVAAFMLYEPPEPPRWRRQETLGQRAHREMIEDCGSWVGD